MMLLRSFRLADLDAIHTLALESGVATLSKDKELLERRIKWSLHSFKKNVKEPKSEYIFFVLEDPRTQKIVGTAAIESAIYSLF
jgi:arginine N-succinyltransferase